MRIFQGCSFLAWAGRDCSGTAQAVRLICTLRPEGSRPSAFICTPEGSRPLPSRLREGRAHRPGEGTYHTRPQEAKGRHSAPPGRYRVRPPRWGGCPRCCTQAHEDRRARALPLSTPHPRVSALLSTVNCQLSTAHRRARALPLSTSHFRVSALLTTDNCQLSTDN